MVDLQKISERRCALSILRQQTRFGVAGTGEPRRPLKDASRRYSAAIVCVKSIPSALATPAP
jgi:hypothetical protein